MPYDAEITDELDISIRSYTYDRRLQLNANVFYSKIKDQQLRQPQSGQFLDNHIVNAGDSHRLGLELNTTVILRNWQLWLSASLLEAEFDDVNAGVNDIETGSQVPNTPEWKFHFGIHYENEGPFFAALDVTSRQQTTWQLTGRQPIVNEGRTLINARFGWRLSNNIELSAWGRNITNEEYFDERDYAQSFAYPGEPRELGLTLTTHW